MLLIVKLKPTKLVEDYRDHFLDVGSTPTVSTSTRPSINSGLAQCEHFIVERKLFLTYEEKGY